MDKTKDNARPKPTANQCSVGIKVFSAKKDKTSLKNIDEYLNSKDTFLQALFSDEVTAKIKKIVDS